MEPIEIKYDKRKLMFGIAIFLIPMMGLLYMAFFSDLLAENYKVKVMVIVLAPLSLFMSFKLFKKMQDDISVVILTKNNIEINQDGKQQAFKWTEITELHIGKKQDGKSEAEFLTITSGTKTTEVNLSALDKSVEDIRELIGKFRPFT